MNKKDFSRLKRTRYDMPDDVAKALRENNLLHSYENRPAYQQNDYIGWINQAKRVETRNKRLNQMLQELKKGNLYMKMKYITKT